MNRFVVLPFLMMLSFALSAQKVEPIKWSFSASDPVACQVTLTFTAELQPHWHLYALEHEVGLPLTFTFDQSSNYGKVGILNSPASHKEYDNILESDVYYYKESTVVFTQSIRISSGHDPFPVKGKIEGQVCSMETGLCIPMEQEFSFTIVSKDHCH